MEFDLLINNTLFYLGAGFLLLAIIFGVVGAFQRDDLRKKRLYMQGVWIFLVIGLVLLLRDTKIAYLEAFAKRLL